MNRDGQWKIGSDIFIRTIYEATESEKPNRKIRFGKSNTTVYNCIQLYTNSSKKKEKGETMAKEKRSSEWETITPDKAKKYLATSEGNPRYGASSKVVNKAALSKLVSDMKANKWIDTGEAIQFDWNGHLINGHHRLTAVVQSGKPQEILVVRGISPMAKLYIDTSTKRSLVQRLAADGFGPEIANTKSVGALRLAICFRKGESFATHSMSDDWFVGFIGDHIEAYSIAYEVAGLNSAKLLSSGAEFAHAIAEAYECGVDRQILKRFCDIVNTGRYSGDGETAALELRNWKISNPQDFGGRRMRERMAASEAIQTYIARFTEGDPTSRRINRNQIMGIYTFRNMEREGKEQ